MQNTVDAWNGNFVRNLTDFFLVAVMITNNAIFEMNIFYCLI